jgi:hypothetical protein
MRKIVISKTDTGEIEIGEPDRMVEHGGSYVASIGRLFQGDKDKQIITIKHQDGLEETFFIKETP